MSDEAPWEDYGPTSQAAPAALTTPPAVREPTPSPTPTAPTDDIPPGMQVTTIHPKNYKPKSVPTPAKTEAAPTPAPVGNDDEPWKDYSPVLPDTAQTTATPGTPQSLLPDPGDMSSSDNPPPGSRYAAARDNLKHMADQMLIGHPSATNAASTFLTRMADTALFHLPRNAAAAVNAWRYGTSFDQEDALLRAEEEAMGRQQPAAAVAGDVAGIAAGAVSLPMIGPQAGASRIAGTMAEQGPGLLSRAGYGALNSGLYSAADQYLNTKNPMQAAQAGLIGAGLGAALTPIAEKVVGMLSTRRTPILDANGNLTPEAVQAALDAGIDRQDIPALQQHLVQEFQRVGGPTVPAARQAQLAEFNIPPTRGQVTADPQQIGREAKLPAESPFGELRGEQQQAVNTAREDMINSPYASPYEALDTATATVQGQRAMAEARKDALYERAYNEPGFFQRSAIASMGQDIRRGLDQESEELDSMMTPYSMRALHLIDNLSQMHVPNAVSRTPPNSAITGIDMRGVENVRKKLNRLYGDAQLKNDRRIMKSIIQKFDEHIFDAHNAGAFSGNSARAAATMQAARRANADYRTRFFANPGDDVGRIVEKVADGRLSPTELAAKFYTDAQVGTGNSARLWDRLSQALGGPNSPGMQAVKDALKMKLLSPNNPNAQGLIGVITDPMRANALEVSKRINNFLNNKGTGLAQRAFTPAELGEFRRYASALNIIAQKGTAPREELAKGVMVGLLKAANRLAPLALMGLHGGLHGAAEGMVLHPVLGKAEKFVEHMAEKSAVNKAMSGAPKLKKVAPTFPLVAPEDERRRVSP